MNCPIASHPRFELGRVIGLDIAGNLLFAGCFREFLQRHASGDWGDLCESDRHANEAALRDGARLFSSYQLRPHSKLWVITESDRSITTLVYWEDDPPPAPTACAVVAPLTQPAQQVARSGSPREA